MKLFKSKLILTFFILFFFYIIYNPYVMGESNSSTAYDIGKYNIDATIMKNGNLHIVEKIEFDFNNNANGIYRDILYKYTYKGQKDDINPSSSRYQSQDVENIKVYKTDNNFQNEIMLNEVSESTAYNGMENSYSISNKINDGYIKRIKIYEPSISGSDKYLKIEYDVVKPTVLYQDVGEMYWNFIGKNWDCSISNVNVNIDFEHEYNGENIKFYPHGYANIINIQNSNGKLSFFIEKLKSKTAIDARIVFPNTYIDSAKKIYNTSYNYNELNKIEDMMSMGKVRNNVSNILNFVIIALAIGYLILLIKKSNEISSKGKNKKIEYYTEPLDNLNLSMYTKLLGGTILNPNLVIATVLDLQYKKVLKMDAQKRLKKSFDGIKYNYYFSINKEAKLNNLNEYERIIINYIFNDKVSNKNIDISNFKNEKIELNEKFKSLSNNYFELNKFRITSSDYDKRLGDIAYKKPDKKLKKLSFYYISLLLIISIINIFVISPLNIEFKFENATIYFVIGIFYIIFSLILTFTRGLKEEYYDEYNKLKGLEKYLKEYSLIKDRYPIEIALWDRYLVFASLFGIAKKVAKEFREELISKGYNDDYIYINYPLLGISMYSTQFASYASNSTGSSSSGGFSGGGAGGGGRWRRPVVVLFNEQNI